MSNLSSNLSTILMNGLNNPDCAFYTGQMFGQIIAFRTIFIILMIYLLLKIIEGIAVNPLIEKIKSYIWRKKS